MSERLGKRMRLIDANGSLHPRSLHISKIDYDIVPVRPKGWMIRVNQGQKSSWAFQSMVFTWLGVLDWMRAKYSLVRTKNDIFNEKLCSFQDIEGIAFQEIEAPPNAQTSMLDRCPSNDIVDSPPSLPQKTNDSWEDTKEPAKKPLMVKALPPAGPIKAIPETVEESFLVMG